jgi:hypothetical protein
MAIAKSADQFRYTGKGPLDAKALVKTYAELLDTATWTIDGKVAAYNGMITAVWLNKDDTSKNGIYFLHDVNCTSALKTPDVTVETNWHKLGGIENLPGLADQISAIQNDLEKVKSDVDELQDSATVVMEFRSQFPETGLPGKIYVAMKEATTYVWYNGDYLPVCDGGDNDEIQIISGGGPTA